MPARHIEYLRVDQIVPAATNPKKHALDGIGDSMARFGYTEPVVMDERTGRLIAGHGRIESLAARHARGEAAPEGIEVDGDGGWMLPVVRGWSSSSDSAAAAALVASNKLVEAGGWDEEMLAELLGDYRSDPDWLTGTGYSDTEVVEFLARLNPDEPVALGDPDDVPEAPAEPVTRLDDVWCLGRHRVLCGDGTTKAGRDRLFGSLAPTLILTDPPYAFGLASTANLSAKAGGWHDMMNNASWFRDRFQEWRSIVPHGPAWVFGNWRTLPILMRGSFDADSSITSVMVWHKDWIGPGGTRGLRPSWELVTLTVHGDYSVPDRGIPDLITVPWSSFKPTGHGAEKPVDLFRHLLEIAGPSTGQVAFDPFLGSGTCIIAAEAVGATCVGSELDERWVDIIATRFQSVTGVVPILESTGEPHDFLTGEDTQPAP